MVFLREQILSKIVQIFFTWLSYVALTGLALWVILFYVGFYPTLFYVAPSGLAGFGKVYIL